MSKLAYNPPDTLIGTEERLALTHRYLYYVLAQTIISDQAYDVLEKRVLAHPDLPADSPMWKVGSSLASSYSDDIKENARRLLKRAKVMGIKTL